MKKVDLGLAGSSLRWVGGPALQPSHQHRSLHRPGLRFPCSQTWDGLPCLQPSSPFFGEKEGLEGPTKACVLCTQAVTLPWMAWTQHTHAAGHLHRPRWAQRWLTVPQRRLHTRWKKPTKHTVGLDSLYSHSISFLQSIFKIFFYPSNSGDELLQLNHIETHRKPFQLSPKLQH